MRRFAVGTCLLATLVVALPQPATAQVGGDLAIGYSFLSNDQLAANATSLPAGWFFDTSVNVSDNVAIAFDFNGHYKRNIAASSVFSGGSEQPVVAPLPTEDFQAFSFNRPEDEYCSPVLTECSVHIQTVGAVAGPRFSFDAGGARPFFHIMAGISRSLRKIGFFGHTATHMAIQPGGGVDIGSGNVGFRLQVDYRLTMFPEPDQSSPGTMSSLVNAGGEDFKDIQFSAGVVVKLGSRRN